MLIAFTIALILCAIAFVWAGVTTKTNTACPAVICLLAAVVSYF